MLRLLKNASLVLFWLALCLLTVSGCQATAPTAVLVELGTATEIAERGFLENLHLFVSTDYGEFCALLACAAAAEVSLLLRRYLFPYLREHTPHLFAYLKGVYVRLLSLFKNRKYVNISLQDEIEVPAALDGEDADGEDSTEHAEDTDGDASTD